MDWNTSSTESVNALIAVAHPDDETVFCGGTMLYYPTWTWTVVCFTWGRHTTRYIQFQNAMKHFRTLGVDISRYLTLEQEDTGKELTQEEWLAWKGAIQCHNLSSDIVFTHNTQGEYGHSHHKSVNTIVHELFSNVWEFICPGAVNPQPFRTKVNEVPLSADILGKKTEVFNRCYKSEHYIWGILREVMEYEFKTGPEIFTSD
jgi:hypothetical protein